jgi:hypothetical protein
MATKSALFYVDAAAKPRFLEAVAEARKIDRDVRPQFFDRLALATLVYMKDVVLKIMKEARFSASRLEDIWTPPFVERFSSATFRSVREGDETAAARSMELTRPRDKTREDARPFVARACADTSTRVTHPALDWPLDVTGLADAVKKLTGEGVPIGMIDSGVNDDHFAVKGRVASFAVATLEGTDSVVKPQTTPSDAHGHGTMVASVIKGHDASGARIGLAPCSDLHVVSVLSEADTLQFNDLQVVAAIEWLAGKKVRLLNISLHSGMMTTPGHELLFAVARKCGMLPIVGIGNAGCGKPTTPGIAKTALSVGAMDRADRVAESSGCGATSPTDWVPKLLAPATVPVAVTTATMHSIVPADPETSFATPFVTGIAALLLQVCPSASVDQLEAALLAPTGKSLSRPGCSACSSPTPVVNFESALAALRKFGVCTGDEHL